MIKILCRRLVLCSSVLLCITAVAAGDTQKDSYRLVSPGLLQGGNLKLLWQDQLPIKKSERLDKLLLVGKYIYALSDQNYMTCLNRQTGRVAFSKPVAPAGVPVLGLRLYKDTLFTMMGGKLVEMSPDLGTERSAETLDYGVACPVARNQSYFYIGAVDRRVHVLGAADKVQVFAVAADNDSQITSVLADESVVVFTTAAGNVIRMAPDSQRRLWRFDATSGIVGSAVQDRDVLFFASKDTHLYCVRTGNGRLVWKYPLGGIPDAAPWVTEETVYQHLSDDTLLALAKDTAESLWQLPHTAALLAEAQAKAYVITKPATLAVMDNNQGRRLYSVNFARVRKYVTNVTDSRMYIADDSGRIACIEPLP